MPFAGYKDFDECVRRNKKKGDPEAYCAVIQRKAEKGDLRESADAYFDAEPIDYALREAVVMLDKAPCPATVVAAPNGDTLVIPQWTGQFDQLHDAYQRPEPYVADDTYSAQFHVEDAARILGQLTRMKRDEKGEGDDAEMLQSAITALTAFIRSESEEIGAQESDAEIPDDNSDIREAMADLTAAAIVEAGRRNSKSDEARLRQIAALVRDLGIVDDDEEDEDDEEPVAEAAVDMSASPEEISFRESGANEGYVLLSESAPQFDPTTRTVWITPIKPGWGNSRDNNFYPVETLREATINGVFNHRKMFKDHPTADDDKKRPERSVKDWFATTREAEWDEVRLRPRVPVVVHDEADFRRMQEAPEQIAFSVLGGGMARPGEVGGRKGRIVEAISKLRSVDWVTEAGAGGAIDFAESASTEEIDMGVLEDLTAEQLAEANPKLYEHLVGIGKALVTVDRDDAAAARVDAKAAKTDEKSADGKTEGSVKESADEIPAWFAPFVPTLQAISTREAASAAATSLQEGQKAAKATVDKAIEGSTLPKHAKEAVAARFAEAAVGEGQPYTEETLTTAVTAALTEAEKILAPLLKGRTSVTGLGESGEPAPELTGKAAVLREAETALESRLGPIVTPRKDRVTFTPDELSGTAPAPAPQPQADAAGINEASAGVQAGIAARMGV